MARYPNLAVHQMRRFLDVTQISVTDMTRFLNETLNLPVMIQDVSPPPCLPLDLETLRLLPLVWGLEETRGIHRLKLIKNTYIGNDMIYRPLTLWSLYALWSNKNHIPAHVRSPMARAFKDQNDQWIIEEVPKRIYFDGTTVYRWNPDERIEEESTVYMEWQTDCYVYQTIAVKELSFTNDLAAVQIEHRPQILHK